MTTAATASLYAEIAREASMGRARGWDMGGCHGPQFKSTSDRMQFKISTHAI